MLRRVSSGGAELSGMCFKGRRNLATVLAAKLLRRASVCGSVGTNSGSTPGRTLVPASAASSLKGSQKQLRRSGSPRLGGLAAPLRGRGVEIRGPRVRRRFTHCKAKLLATAAASSSADTWTATAMATHIVWSARIIWTQCTWKTWTLETRKA